MSSAISVWPNPNTSPSTNTARSNGDRVSSTTSIAYDTESAISTSSAASGDVNSGSGSQGPTYVSWRARADCISFRARFVTVLTRYAFGARTCSASVRDQRSHASWTTSSASATLPVNRYATENSSGRLSVNTSVDMFSAWHSATGEGGEPLGDRPVARTPRHL